MSLPRLVRDPVAPTQLSLPAPEHVMAQAQPDTRWVETVPELEALVADLRPGGRLAFDTEFVSEDTFDPVLGLIQVAWPGGLAVIDPLAVTDLRPFWDLLHDPAIELVTHAASEDLRIVRLQSGRLPARVVDVQLAAGLVGYGYPISLSNLVRQEAGVSLAGSETRTDWRRRPLTDAQVDYALDDVRYLLDIADRLQARLAKWGRLQWAEDEYRELLAAVEQRGDDEERWRRLPGLHNLSRRSLEVARRLAAWRLEQARRSNRPVRQLLRDDLLVAIARRRPRSRKDLEALRDFNRPHLTARAADFVQIVEAAERVPESDLPEHGERREETPGQAMVVGLLTATLHQACNEQRISSALVGTNSDLKDLISWHVRGRREHERPALASGWRRAMCGELLLEVLEGRRTLRISDPTADVPVVLEPRTDEPPPLPA